MDGTTITCKYIVIRFNGMYVTNINSILNSLRGVQIWIISLHYYCTHGLPDLIQIREEYVAQLMKTKHITVRLYANTQPFLDYFVSIVKFKLNKDIYIKSLQAFIIYCKEIMKYTILANWVQSIFSFC